jgi:branched-chain amino acid aminotransferase
LGAYEPLRLDPSAMVLHYGQAIFEGLKAYRQPDGGVALFRPHENANRFARSAERLAMPALPASAFVESCVAAAQLSVVPAASGQSTYLRPLMVADEPALGVRAASEYLYVVLTSPAGSYFANGMKPIAVWVVDEFVRAVRGGTGAAKCAGNYAASLAGRLEATKAGCDEALWLDALERRWIEELSGMNVVFVEYAPEGATLVAPPTGETVLDGVTRRSLLEMAKRLGYDVVERPVAIDDVFDDRFDEAFACGTAGVVAPIGSVASSARGCATIGNGAPGAVTLQLREALLALQEGRADDPFGWRHDVVRVSLLHEKV